MKPIDFNTELLSKSLSLRLQKHATLAGNIANADTPGYRPTKIAFESELQKAAQTKSSDRLNKIHGKIQTIDDGIPRPDGNSVSIDKQMAEMTENTLVYNATAEFIARRMRMLKSVIG
ncbi:MAG: flagellar basal body rod protein FlgB [Deltaproteobacteria bacterium]|nr:flagellar basal body rod protein FlgB [Deltaproteobacteria bacterium]